MPDLLERLQAFERPDLTDRLAAFEQPVGTLDYPRAPGGQMPPTMLGVGGAGQTIATPFPAQRQPTVIPQDDEPSYLGLDKEVQVRLSSQPRQVEPYEYGMYAKSIDEMARDLAASRAGRPVKARDYVRKLPQALWPVLEEETRRRARESADFRREGVTVKALKGFASGLVSTGQNLQRMVGMDSLNSAQEEAARGVLSAAEGIDPLIPQHWKWYDPRKWIVGAAQMAYPAATGMVGMAATGGAAGPLAAHVTGGAFWFTQTFPDRYDEYKAEGMSDQYATPAAVLSSALEAAIETFEMVPVVPKGMGALARGQIKAFAKQFATQYGKELSEETMQAFVSEGVKAFTSRLDEEMPDTDLSKLIKEPVEQTLEAMGPLFVMMAPGHMAAKIAQPKTEESGVAKSQGESAPQPSEARKAPSGSKAELLTPEGASEWVRNNPEASRAIVQQIKRTESLPARGAFEAVAPRGSGEKWSAAERTAFGGMVQEAVGASGRFSVSDFLPLMQEAVRISAGIKNVDTAPGVLVRWSQRGKRFDGITTGRVVDGAVELLDVEAVPGESKPQFGGSSFISVRQFKDAEKHNAQGIREDAGRVQETGDVGQGGEGQGRANLEQQAQEQLGNAEEAQVQQKVASATPNVRPELAIPVTQESARDIMRQVDTERQAAGVPTVESRAAARREGVARYNADPVAAREQLLSAGTGQMPFRDTADHYAAVEVMTDEALSAVADGTPEALLSAKRYYDAYRESGTQMARMFGARRDTVQTPRERAGLLADSLLAMPAEMQARRDAAQKSGAAETVAKIDQQWADNAARLIKAMKAAGYDPARLEEVVQSESRTAKLFGLMHRMHKGSGWDMAQEFYRNSLLSGPKTQERNFLSNTAFNAFRLTAQRLVEVGINTITRNPEGAQLGELPYLYAGLLPGLCRAARNTLLTWQSETQWLEWQLGRKGAGSKFDFSGTAIPGRTGRTIRIPQRLLVAADQGQKALTATMEVGAYAWRISKAEGLKGEAMQRRIAELVLDTHSAAWDAALKSADIGTFTQELGQIGKGLMTIRRVGEPVSPLKFIFTFVTAPANIFKRFTHFTPLYTPVLAAKMALARYQGKQVDWTPDLAEQMLGYLTFLTILGTNDPDDPWITGALDGRDPRTRAMSRRTFKPMSIHVGDRSFSYGWLEPFATTLGWLVDTTNAMQRGSAGEIAEAPVRSFMAQLHDKTYLDGISDLVEFASLERGQTIGEKAAKLASSFLTAWVPNVAKEPMRAGRDYYPERGIWGKGSDWYNMALVRTAQKTEVLTPLFSDLPARDIWGRPAKTPVSIVPRTDYLWRLFSPIDVGQPDIFVGDRILMAWNSQHPDDEPKNPEAPDRFFRLRGKTYYYTPAEYDRLVGDAGAHAANLVQMAADNAWRNTDLSKPKQAHIDFIEKVITEGRKVARERIIAERRRNGWTPD